jgi:hypothetical protein
MLINAVTDLRPESLPASHGVGLASLPAMIKPPARRLAPPEEGAYAHHRTEKNARPYLGNAELRCLVGRADLGELLRIVANYLSAEVSRLPTVPGLRFRGLPLIRQDHRRICHANTSP